MKQPTAKLTVYTGTNRIFLSTDTGDDFTKHSYIGSIEHESDRRLSQLLLTEPMPGFYGNQKRVLKNQVGRFSYSINLCAK